MYSLLFVTLNLGLDDLLMFAVYYLRSFVVAGLAMIVLLVASFFVRRLSSGHSSSAMCLLWVSALPIVCWVVYFCLTCSFTKTLIILNSESDDAAEMAYERLFKRQVTTVDRAVDLAIDTGEAPNVRFYAACLVADLLTNASSNEVDRVLIRVENAPRIEPGFMGGNRLTDQFYIPGHVPPSLSVKTIVTTRLEVFRNLRK
jgi:hypothetical protein